MAMHRLENGGGRRTPYAGLDTQRTPAPTRTSGVAIIRQPANVGDLLAWRCRAGRCVSRPQHDPMDWWPTWARRSA
jgi:hypothetical protein